MSKIKELKDQLAVLHRRKVLRGHLPHELAEIEKEIKEVEACLNFLDPDLKRTKEVLDCLNASWSPKTGFKNKPDPEI